MSKNFTKFQEDLNMNEIDVISDILNSLNVIPEEYDNISEALEETNNLLLKIGLTFNVDEVEEQLKEKEEVEILLVSTNDEEETVLEINSEGENKINGEMYLHVKKLDEDTIEPSVVVYFDEEDAKKLSDVEFEPITEEEKEKDCIVWGWIDENGVIDSGEKEVDKAANFTKGWIKYCVENNFLKLKSPQKRISEISKRQFSTIKQIYQKNDENIYGIIIKFSDVERRIEHFLELEQLWKKRVEDSKTIIEGRHATEDYIDWGWIDEVGIIISGERQLGHIDLHTEVLDRNNEPIGSMEKGFRRGWIRYFIDESGNFLQLENLQKEFSEISKRQFSAIEKLARDYDVHIYSIVVEFLGMDRSFENVYSLKRAWKNELEKVKIVGEEKNFNEPDEDIDIDDEKPDDEKPDEDDVVDCLTLAVKKMMKKENVELDDKEISTIVDNLKTSLEYELFGEDEKKIKIEPERKQDSTTEVVVYEEKNKDKKIFNVVLLKPTTRLVLSRVISAKTEKELEKIIKDEYPDFIILSTDEVFQLDFD